MTGLTHIDEAGAARMVDVGGKAVTAREAVASGRITMSAEAAAAIGAGAGVLSIFGIDTALGSADTWELVGRMLLAFALWALVGIGVGTVVRNQVAAIVIVLAITLFIEPIVRTIGGVVEGFDDVVKWFPSAASDALVGQTIFSSVSTTGASTLDWWVGGLVLLGYAVVLVVVGMLTTWRRDID